MCWSVTFLHSDTNPSPSTIMDNESETSSLPSSSNTPSTSQDCESDDPDVFYFESDHLALKGNKDYHSMLRVICELEAQRVQATRDLETLMSCERRALSDPVQFVERLQHGADLGLPPPARVAALPAVQWEKYTSSVDPMNLAARKPVTRKRQGGVEQADTPQTSMAPTSVKLEPCTSSSSSDAGTGAGGGDGGVVRGRVKDENKSRTFNQLWTAEEQRHLEELLIIHQPEAVEARRWDKIATALGNRSTQQVASRVQKYFIRLAKAGLPIPGRMPNLNAHIKKGSTHRHQRFNRMYFQPSTFMQAYQPPVYMPDTEDDPFGHRKPHASHATADVSPPVYIPNTEDDLLGHSRPQMSHPTGHLRPHVSHATADVSDEEDIPAEKRLTVEYQELIRLKQLRRKKLAEQDMAEHIGYKCDQCGCEPIEGTRWHCADCPEEVSVDFCDECMDCQYENGTHQPHHKLEPVQLVQQREGALSGRHMDRDYLQGSRQGNYNYLDPNYMPAS